MNLGSLTAGELTLLRTRPQRSMLRLAVPNYGVIGRASVNAAPASNDAVTQIDIGASYTPGLGYTDIRDVKSGMTLLVGTVAGGSDVGICRIRQDGALLDDHFHIGTTSEIAWVNALHLTVTSEFGLWPRHPYIDPTTGTAYMDYDIPYTNQHQYGNPIIIMGSHAVLELTGATVSTTFDASASYSCIGAVVSWTYAWACVGATVATPAASSTLITFSGPGTFIVECSVTANYGGGNTQTSLARRYVIVWASYQPLITAPVLESCYGDYDSGGWEYRVTLHSQATDTYIKDRTLAILVSDDYYGSTHQSIGPETGRENIVCVGWIDGESITRSNDTGDVSFTVQGPMRWLEKIEGFPTGVDDTTTTPDWSHILALNTQAGLFHFLYWRTTLPGVTDCYLAADTHRLATTYTPAGSLSEQLRAINDRILAKAVADRYGRVYCYVDTQFVDPALRLPPPAVPPFPVVQTMADTDWRDEIGIERRIVPECSLVDLSGVYWSGLIATSQAYFGLAPGHYYKRLGSSQKVEHLALADQAETNALAGLYLGYLNNEYPNVDVRMSSNYRAVDIAPRMFVQMSLAAGDTPRGIVWLNKKFIPRRVEFERDDSEAVMLTNITFEAESFPSQAQNGDPPIEPPPPPDPPDPPLLCNDPLALNFGGLAPCIYQPIIEIWGIMTFDQLKVTTNFSAVSPNWTDATDASLHGANVGDFLNFVMTSTGGAYLLTYKDLATKADNGLWYTPSVTSPVWSLILSVTAFQAFLDVEVNDARHLISLAIDSSNTAYAAHAPAYIGPAEQGYVSASGGVAAWNAQPAPASHMPASGTEFGAWADGTETRLADGWYTGPWAEVWSPSAGTFVEWFPGILTEQKAYSVCENYVVTNFSNLYSYTMAGVGALIVATGDGTFPLVEYGGAVYYIHSVGADATGIYLDLMSYDGAVAIVAAPNDRVGFSGVFSTTGASSASFIFDAATGDLVWIAGSASTSNNKRSIALYDGATWTTKDGDFGAYHGANGAIIPVIKHISI